MDIHEPKLCVALRIPASTVKQIKRGRKKVNMSHEIRRLVNIGLQNEGIIAIQETTESGAETS